MCHELLRGLLKLSPSPLASPVDGAAQRSERSDTRSPVDGGFLIEARAWSSHTDLRESEHLRTEVCAPTPEPHIFVCPNVSEPPATGRLMEVSMEVKQCRTGRVDGGARAPLSVRAQSRLVDNRQRRPSAALLQERNQDGTHVRPMLTSKSARAPWPA